METVVPSVDDPQAVPLWQTVGRWSALLPGAVLGSLVAYWIAKLMSWVHSSRFGNDSWGWYLWTTAFEAFVQGWAFVLVAVWVAPAGKKVVAYSSACVIIFFMGGSAFLSLPKRDWMLFVAIGATIGGAVVATVSSVKRNA